MSGSNQKTKTPKLPMGLFCVTSESDRRSFPEPRINNYCSWAIRGLKSTRWPYV